MGSDTTRNTSRTQQKRSRSSKPRKNRESEPTLPSLLESPERLSSATTALELLPFLRPTMKAIAESVGPFCEVVLHDLTSGDVEHTIVAIENGHVTGRTVGGPVTSVGLEFLRRRADDNDFGYYTHTPDGRELRSSSVYFRNDAGEPIAVLCINVDMTPFHALQQSLSALLDRGDIRDSAEVMSNDIDDVLDNLIETAVRSIGSPVALMTRSDKVRVIQLLDRSGAFMVRHAVDRIAERLNVSRVTAYNYLDQSRTTDDGAETRQDSA